MAQDLALSILIQANDQASKIITGLTASFGPVGTAIAGASIAAIGFGAQSVKMAGDFQQSMSTLVTSAGESQSNLKMVSDGVLQISTQTGTSTEQLAHGMYMIESSGQHGAAGLAVLKAAAEGAKAENADLGTVTNAVTTLMTDYSKSHITATQSMNALTATVASGKTNLQNLASAMGNVLPLASSLGIQFPQVAGALAVMTNSGMSAQRASMNLANAIRSLSAPSGIAQKSMQSVGLSAQELKDTLSTKGLSGAIQLVEEHVGKTFPAGSVQAVTAFKNIMGGATGYNVALMVGGDHMKAYEANIASITKAMQSGSDEVMGWSETQGNFNVQVDRAKAALAAVQITLGEALLPALTSLLARVTPLITGFITWENQTHGLEAAMHAIGAAISNVVSVGAGIISFFQHNQVAMAALIVVLGALRGALTLFVVAGIADAILSMMEFGLSILTTTAEAVTGATTMISTFTTMAGLIGTSMGVVAGEILATMGPFLLIGAISGLVIAGIILAIQHWSEITQAFNSTWQAATTLWSNAVQNVGNWMKQNQLIVDAFAAAILGVAAAFLYANAGAISGFATSVVQMGVKLAGVAQVQIAEFIASLGTAKASLISTATTAVADFIATIPGLVAGFGAWAVGAGSAAIATIAASLPLIAIGAAVAAAVFLIIVAIQHWGEISAWLQAQWQRFSSWFMGMWDSFTHIPAVAATITFFQNAWKNITDGARTAGTNISTALSGAWQNISTQAQQKLGPPLNSLWDTIKQRAQQAGNDISKAMQQAWKLAQQAWQQSPLSGAFDTMIKAFQNLGPVIKKTLQDQLGPIGAGFAQIGPTLKSQLGTAFSGLAPAFANLKKSFDDAWKNIVSSGQTIASTVAPAWKQLQQSFDAISKVVGGALVGAWKQLQPALDGVGKAIGGAFASSWKSLQQSFSEIGKTLSSTLVPAWKSLQQSLAQVGAAVGGAFGTAWKTLAPIFAQIGATVGGAFSTAWKTLAPILAQIGATVGGAFSAAWKALAPIFAQIGQAVGGQLLVALQAIGIVIGGVVLVAISLLLGLIVGLAKGFAALITGLATTISGIVQFFSGIVQVISGFIALIIDLCTGNFGKLGTDLGVIWAGVVTMFQGVWTAIQGIFQSTVGVIVAIVSGLVTTVIQFFTNLANTLVGHSIIPDMLTAIVTAFTQFFTTVLAGITTWINGVIQWFTQLWTQAQALFKTAMTTLTSLLQQGWQTISNGVQTAWNGIINWLKGAASNLQNAIETPFKTAISAVQSLWNGLQSTVNSVVSSIKSSISSVASAIGGVSISGHATGILNSPTGHLAWVGEQGPELMYVPAGSSIFPNGSSPFNVVNTSSGDSAASAPGTITITINAPQRTQNEAKTITDAVSKELAKRYRLQLGTVSIGGSNI